MPMLVLLGFHEWLLEALFFGSQCRTLDVHISITGDCKLSRVEVEWNLPCHHTSCCFFFKICPHPCRLNCWNVRVYFIGHLFRLLRTYWLYWGIYFVCSVRIYCSKELRGGTSHILVLSGPTSSYLIEIFAQTPLVLIINDCVCGKIKSPLASISDLGVTQWPP